MVYTIWENKGNMCFPSFRGTRGFQYEMNPPSFIFQHSE